MWEDEQESAGPQPAPTAMTTYREAVGEFTRNANVLIENIPLFAKVRDAYERAVRASADVRDILDSGDETLRILMTDLDQAINLHAGTAIFNRRRAEASQFETIKSENRGPLAVNE